MVQQRYPKKFVKWVKNNLPAEIRVLDACELGYEIFENDGNDEISENWKLADLSTMVVSARQNSYLKQKKISKKSS